MGLLLFHEEGFQYAKMKYNTYTYPFKMNQHVIGKRCLNVLKSHLFEKHSIDNCNEHDD